MQTTARRVEDSRQMEFYRRMMVADSLIQTEATEIFNSNFRNRDFQRDQFGNILPVNRGIQTTESFSVRVTGDDKEVVFSGDFQTWVGNSDYNYELIPESDSGPSGSNLEKSVNPDQMITKVDFQRWIIKKSEELRRLGDQMVVELYDWEVGTEADLNEVYNTLKVDLENSGIDTPFEFAIIENNSVVDGRIEKSTPEEFLSSIFNVALFSERLIQKDTRLALVFPKQTNFILGSMAVILIASMLFSLIIMVTFALSLLFILRQKKMSEMKSDFINNMTHEFKTPIATISLAADTISNPKVIGDQERIKHFISMIKKENTRMNKQVETILQISTLDKNELEFNFEKVDIHIIISQAIETIGIQVEGRKGNIFYYPEAKLYVTNGDSEHLTNLIHNLLDNANKYSANEPEITIRTENSSGYVIISVEDKGIGMTKAVQSKIFERFYRQSSGDIHNVKGFGLGLSYVRAIVEAHNGRIEVFSEPGKGTKFEVFLPLDNSRK
jgi:two-component system phosphate regulon sensor histidine kinase PhoR